KIKYDILIERHNLYKKAGVKDFWILNDDIHKYGISNKEEDLSKHRLCGLEKAIYDTFQAIYYLDTHVALFRVLKHYTMLWNTILEGKEHIFMFNKVKIKNGTWYTEEDELYEIERKKEIERQKENEENQKNNYTKILAYRIIDYYYPTGTRFKGTMSIVEICKNGKLTEFQLIKDIEALDLNIIYKQPYNIQPLLKKKLIDYYEYFVNNNSKRNIIIDSPMDWIRSDSFYIHNYLNLEHTLRFLKQDCIFRYKWWKKESKWFLPKDNRDMKWDP
ncbi:MAG: hypothetical protein KAS62_12310, partial [Candidatus Delongbacteria bacterium]|nr:hypothetical protein [Candidatus Delongbacteria bacterium]